MYPIKSAYGVSVQNAQLSLNGLTAGPLQDRSFMVVTEKDGTFVTGRQAGALLGVKITLGDDHTLTLHAHGHDAVKVDLQSTIKHSRTIESKIWGESVRGVDCGDMVAQWLSAVLYKGETRVRLIHKGGVMERRPPRKLHYYTFPRIKDSDSLYYQDTAAIHLTTVTSLDDLNSRLDQPVTMANFRPNIVVGGTIEPFTEDSWVAVRVGNAVIRKIKPSERCLLTTINPENGERHPDHEPMKTLRSYRLISQPSELAKTWAAKPVFGAHFALDHGGEIRVGEKVMAATVSANPHISVF
ncbi:hypothetical protein Pcinc_007232 [Petrolisthes cinctipes]|uniref:MOSC domain-containing protein n=1 Tax=Petrolisthes cinctipes TaxID=88211 RepID=A0AAE1KYE0_PETCI|nr:hypothetical protein Pcinc_007232 [Petrolisthes cinctipes]